MIHETQIQWDALGHSLSPEAKAISNAKRAYEETQYLANQELAAEMFRVAIQQASR